MTILSLLIVLAAPLTAQVEKPRPKFTDYSVKEIYRGKPASPVLVGDDRKFRTMIRRGANSPVEFGGHYTVPRWGCGAGCSMFAIVDSVSGRVVERLLVADLPFSWADDQKIEVPDRVEFHPDSRLLKVNGCPNETNCGFYDYLIEDRKGLTLVRKELLPQKFQP
jgi:hypothetical protein